MKRQRMKEDSSDGVTKRDIEWEGLWKEKKKNEDERERLREED